MHFLRHFHFLILSEYIRDLLVWMKENILTERPELFIQDGSV